MHSGRLYNFLLICEILPLQTLRKKIRLQKGKILPQESKPHAPPNRILDLVCEMNPKSKYGIMKYFVLLSFLWQYNKAILNKFVTSEGVFHLFEVIFISSIFRKTFNKEMLCTFLTAWVKFMECDGIT